MVDLLADELEMDPVELRMKNFIRPEQFPYTTKTGWTYDSGDYAEAMREALRIAGYDDLRREQAEKRARGELMGIGVSFFTETVGAGPRKDMDIAGLGMADGAELRVHPTGKAIRAALGQDAGPGARDDVRPDRRRGAGHPARGRRGRSTATPTRRRSGSAPTARARRRCRARRWRWWRARSATRRRLIAAAALEASAGRPRVGEGPLVRDGRPRAGQDDPGAGVRLARVARAARGRRGRTSMPSRSTTRPTSPIPTAPTSASSTSTRARARSSCGASSPSTTAASASTR